jgi:cytochrome c-type biogenesis protein CcmH/NrfF
VRRIALTIVLLILVAPPAAAAGCRRTSLPAIENTVMCQVCGVPLGLATESPEAARERAFISNLIDRCETPTQIRAALVKQYGPSVLALPPKNGFDLTAYLVPLLGLLCAAALLAVVAIAWRGRHRATEPPAAHPLTAADAARVDAALERFER